MVVVCPDTYPDNETYQEYFDLFPYELSPFQKYAVEGIVKGDHVLVTAPTGSGKTMPAAFSITYFVQKGKKVIYTVPIKSLGQQKFYEFSKAYPHISFGILNGDIKINPSADVLICTTEILQNYLFTNQCEETTDQREETTDQREETTDQREETTDQREETTDQREETTDQREETTEKGKDLKGTVGSLNFQIDIQNELGCVIFDEVHYINDQERGQVWEKTFLMLPPHVQTVSLSATIDNPQGFAQWIEDRHTGPDQKQVYLASTNHRIVPLSHYGFITTTESIFKHVKDKDIQKQIRDNTNTLIPLQDASNKFSDAGYLAIKKYTKLLEDNQVHINRKHTMNQLLLFLRDRDMLPAIAFIFSRKNVEAIASEITVPLLEDDSKIPYTTARECEQIMRKFPNYQEYLQLPEYNTLVKLLEKGIGIHHSGMLPCLKELVELFISQKKIKLLCATESFAIGLDCPIRTAIFTSLTKFDGNTDRYLLAHEYTQAAGRAGRRGLDTVGHVVHCNNLFKVPTMTEYKTILSGIPQTLVSKFHISYGLILSLLKNQEGGKVGAEEIYRFCEKSMVKGEIDHATVGIRKNIELLEDAIVKKKQSITLKSTPLDVCQHYLMCEETLKTSVNKKRKECERTLATLKDNHKNLLKDIVAVRELDALTTDRDREYVSLESNQSWIQTNVDAVCQLMVNHGFIVKSKDESTQYEATLLGKMAASLAEVNPLIMAKMMLDTDYFQHYTTKQLVGLFSCYTDVKVSDEVRAAIPSCEDAIVNAGVKQMVIILCDMLDKAVGDLCLFTGVNYDQLLMFDMIQYAMDWTDCTTEQECKYFIQAVISEKGISVGDFTKAMMKIVTIAREIENVCEIVFEGSQVELLHKLRQIEGLVLKYVLTSQSLYL
jgi:superfamily II RNA helicase